MQLPNFNLNVPKSRKGLREIGTKLGKLTSKAHQVQNIFCHLYLLFLILSLISISRSRSTRAGTDHFYIGRIAIYNLYHELTQCMEEIVSSASLVRPWYCSLVKGTDDM